MSFRFTTSETRGVYRMHLVGDLDLAAFDEVDRELQRLQSNGEGKVIVDLHERTFMDSTGLRAPSSSHRSGRSIEALSCYWPNLPRPRRSCSA